MHELQLPIQNWLKFLSSQAGRDKVYRFIQYFSRFLAYHIKNQTGLADLAIRLSKLSLAVGLGRKCTGPSYLHRIIMIVFRIGKPLDFTQSALKALSNNDEVVRWGMVIKCGGYGGWLILDMLQWVRA